MPTTPLTENYRGKVSFRGPENADDRTYALENASANVRLYVFHELLDLLLDPALGLQNLTAFDVQETEGVNIAKSVEELRLREGVLGVILGLLECHASLREKENQVSRKGRSPRTLGVPLG